MLLECCALVQRRLGLPAVRAIQEDMVPVLQVRWIDDRTHALGMAAVLAAGRRNLSLVDCTSFVLMRESGIQAAFAFDKHFREEGFTCLQ